MLATLVDCDIVIIKREIELSAKLKSKNGEIR